MYRNLKYMYWWKLTLFGLLESAGKCNIKTGSRWLILNTKSTKLFILHHFDLFHGDMNYDDSRLYFSWCASKCKIIEVIGYSIFISNISTWSKRPSNCSLQSSVLPGKTNKSILSHVCKMIGGGASYRKA